MLTPSIGIEKFQNIFADVDQKSDHEHFADLLTEAFALIWSENTAVAKGNSINPVNLSICQNSSSSLSKW